MQCFEALFRWYLLDMNNKNVGVSDDSQPVLRPNLNMVINQKFSSPLKGSLRQPLSHRPYNRIFDTIIKKLN